MQMSKKRKAEEDKEPEWVVPNIENPGKVFDLIQTKLTPDLMEQITEFYREHGYLVIKILHGRERKKAVEEQVEKILMQQPWKEKLEVLDTNGQRIDFQQTPKRFVKRLLESPISTKALGLYEKAWCMHKEFGACSDPAAFHLKTVWDIRQKPILVAIVRALLGNRNLWVDINRSIQKLPTKGETEFLHWDLPKLTMKYRSDTQVQGKVAYTSSRMIIAPGTHTEAMDAEIKRMYTPLYHTKKDEKKFKLSLRKDDPLDLVGKVKHFHIPAGCVVFWSPNLLHGQTKTPKTDPIEFGMYLGYMQATDRPEYADTAQEVLKNHQARYRENAFLINRPCGELFDRIYSYKNGVAPILWPSLDEIHFVPHLASISDRLMIYCKEKMTPENQRKYVTEYTDKSGKKHVALKPWKGEYTAPQLSDLGKRLLGYSDSNLAAYHQEMGRLEQEATRSSRAKDCRRLLEDM